MIYRRQHLRYFWQDELHTYVRQKLATGMARVNRLKDYWAQDEHVRNLFF